jgi:hypothetical protein
MESLIKVKNSKAFLMDPIFQKEKKQMSIMNIIVMGV